MDRESRKQFDKLALIRRLAWARSQSDPLLSQIGKPEDLEMAPELVLLGLPEGTIVAIVESYWLLKEHQLEDPEIFRRIEHHRSQFSGKRNLPSPLTLSTYVKHRLKIDCPSPIPIPDSFIDYAIRETQEAFASTSHNGMTDPPESTLPLLNKQGNTAGSLMRAQEGAKPTLHLSRDADIITIVTSLLATAFDDLSPGRKIYFSKWASLPPNSWSDRHRQLFALTFVHYLQDAKRSGHPLPDALHEILKFVPDDPLSPLVSTITPGIRAIYRSLFESHSPPANICDRCGFEFNTNARFCSHCGTPINK